MKKGNILGSLGVVTQCVNSDNICPIPRGYFNNILLKINGKLGGINQVVMEQEWNSLKNFPRDKTMVIGIDVNHPSTDEASGCSVSAAVGSFDKTFSRYAASVRVQKFDRNESVEMLDSMVEDLLNEYNKINKCFPSCLIIFRDGVSEGQFDMIKKKELPLVKKAIAKLNATIKIVLIIVQKRHHTRFVSIAGNNGPKGNSHNVPSGTVVDSSIVNPHYDSFYLNSHFSMLVCVLIFFFGCFIFVFTFIDYFREHLNHPSMLSFKMI